MLKRSGIVDWLVKTFTTRGPPRYNPRRRSVSLRVEGLEDRTQPSTILGTAGNFAVLSGAAVTNTGPSIIFGDLGVSPGTAVTGFPPGLVTNGTIHSADAVAGQAQADLTTAYNALASMAITATLTGQDLGGLTLTPGVYFFSTSAQLTGTLTLDAQGDPDAEFVFQIGTTLVTASNSNVVLINGGTPCDLFWQVGSSATLGTTTEFQGHILALQSISLLTGANVNGSVLARNGAVTLDSNSVSIAACLEGTISGQKFNDLNGDGIQQPGDLGLAGVTFFLDANNNGVLDPGETSTVTDASGNYTFDGLLPGIYLVREVQPSGSLQTTVNPAPILLIAEQDVLGVNIGNFMMVSIGGQKFGDANGNGVQNPGDVGLAGFTIFIDANNNGILDPGEVNTVTDASGNYTFTNVGPGTYTIREVQQPGYTQTTVNPGTIAAISGTNVGGVAFGNFQLISIGGQKYGDTTGNGTQDPADPGLAGFTIFIDANNNGVLDPGERSTVTDANGNYTFANVGPGTYIIREVQQTGFIQTTVNPGAIAAISGTNVAGVTFGNFQLITLGGQKFGDINGNGVQNPGDLGLAGFTIYIDANNNGVLDPGERSTVTDANGNYSFANVGPGTYIIREVQQTGFTQTTVNPGAIPATSGGNVGDITFGNFQLISIGGVKFGDTTGNGVRNPNDPGLAGFTIYIDANNNGVLDPGERNTVTDVNGNYIFTNIGPGTYIIREVQKPGFIQTTVNPAGIPATSGGNVTDITFGNFQLISIGGVKFGDTTGNGVRNPNDPGLAGFTIYIDANNNGVLDPGERNTVTDANGNYIFTNVGPGTYIIREVQKPGFIQTTVNPAGIAATSGGNVTDITFGNFQLISIGGAKFGDTTGNGVRNPNDPGLAGFTIYIDANNNGVLDPGERNTVTDANGNYIFTNVGPGTYIIREVQKPGFIQTTVNPAGIPVTSGGNVTDITFGNFQLISIGGVKFGDTTGNGVRNPNDPGLAGFTIYIDANNNGVLDPGERNTVTDANGNYIFTNIGPGTYIIREVQKPGFIQTTVNPAGIPATSGGNVTDITFGNFQLISIGGAKFGDMNGNGVRNPGDLGLAGFTIYIDANNNGILDPGERRTVTDANGNYSFANIGPGTYIIREVQQPGFVQTTVNPDGIPATSGSSVGGVTFGNFRLISINGTKFRDSNGNGVRNGGEVGIAGFTIFIDANNNGVLDPGERSTVTDAYGNYSFANIGPGTYIIREVQQTGYTQTTVNPGSIPAVSGNNVFSVTFGNFQMISISGIKFQDTNGNGVRNAGEGGLAGVTIYIDANNNGVLDLGERRTVTSANGSFSFPNLGPGIYRIREVTPPGYVRMTNNPLPIYATSGLNSSSILFGNMAVGSLAAPGKLLMIGNNLINLQNGTFARQVNYLASLYGALLGRAPDLNGLIYFSRLFLAGYNEQQVLAFFRQNFRL